MDSLRIYTADKALNPDFKGPCAQGHFQPAEFLESGGKMDDKLDPASNAPKSERLFPEWTQVVPQPSDGCCVADWARDE